MELHHTSAFTRSTMAAASVASSAAAAAAWLGGVAAIGLVAVVALHQNTSRPDTGAVQSSPVAPAIAKPMLVYEGQVVVADREAWEARRQVAEQVDTLTRIARHAGGEVRMGEVHYSRARVPQQAQGPVPALRISLWLRVSVPQRADSAAAQQQLQGWGLREISHGR